MKTTPPEKISDQLRKEAKKVFKSNSELKASGWAGLSKKGRLVDRRQHPDAVPCRKNSFLGFAEPKTDEELKALINEQQ